MRSSGPVTIAATRCRIATSCRSPLSRVADTRGGASACVAARTVGVAPGLPSVAARRNVMTSVRHAAKHIVRPSVLLLTLAACVDSQRASPTASRTSFEAQVPTTSSPTTDVRAQRTESPSGDELCDAVTRNAAVLRAELSRPRHSRAWATGGRGSCTSACSRRPARSTGWQSTFSGSPSRARSDCRGGWCPRRRAGHA